MLFLSSIDRLADNVITSKSEDNANKREELKFRQEALQLEERRMRAELELRWKALETEARKAAAQEENMTKVLELTTKSQESMMHSQAKMMEVIAHLLSTQKGSATDNPP